MRKTAFLLGILMLAAVSASAQTTEFGVLFGGSKRVIRNADMAGEPISEGFSLSNSSVDLYYAVQVDPGTMFKLRVGRIDTPVSLREGDLRRDFADGQVQHAEGLIEYRFDEPFGSSGLYAGVGVYRHEVQGQNSTTDYGFPVGVTADFPLTRRYGVILDASYHFTHAEFRPRYLTVSAGLRLGF